MKFNNNYRDFLLPFSASILGILVSLFFWYHIAQKSTEPEIFKDLRASKTHREEQCIQRYTSLRIPLPIAQLAGHIDRLEDDITRLRQLLKNSSTIPPEEYSLIKTKIKNRKEESRAILKNNRPTIDKYEEKARREKDSATLKLIHVLKSQSFLFERTK